MRSIFFTKIMHMLLTVIGQSMQVYIFVSDRMHSATITQYENVTSMMHICIHKGT